MIGLAGPLPRGSKFLLGVFFMGLLGLGALVIFSNVWVVGSSHSSVFHDVGAIKANEVGLILGTSKKIAPNRANLHFLHRVEAGAELYKKGKVKHLLVSGDNSTVYYNEPRDMKKALMELGVPKEAITSDYAGFRTFDSVVRAGKVFGLKEFTIVSDGFHVPRAVFLARSQGLEVVALASRDVAGKGAFKAKSREWLARVKAVLDVYLFRTSPKFLGEPVEIRIGEPEKMTSDETPEE